jgi:hypothetical protein
MTFLFDPLEPISHPDLFTLMWVAGPAILALHEWVFWPIAIAWGITPLLVVIHVPLLLLLLVQLPAIAIVVWATFIKFPPVIAAANDEIRRRRFVPPPRRDERVRARPTPAGRRRSHRR